MSKIITIDIFSDTVCPWCYIGLTKLKKVIYKIPKKNIELIWRPFQLNPDMPAMGMERHKYLELKFDGKQKAKDTYDLIYKNGLDLNIYFQFDKILTTPNSFPSHKLLSLAHKKNKQTEVVESLFYSYFIGGIDIGKIEELIKISKQFNIYDKNTLEYLTSDEDSEDLLREEKHARELGIKGVPCFVINKEYVLFGAQDSSNFKKIFAKI